MGAISWVLWHLSCRKLAHLLVEQDLLRLLGALHHLAGVTVHPRALEIAS